MTTGLGVFLLAVGLTGLLRPEWHAAIERRRRTTLATNSPRDIELSESWYEFTRMVSLLFAVGGAVFLLNGLL